VPLVAQRLAQPIDAIADPRRDGSITAIMSARGVLVAWGIRVPGS
jgi:hypothetical protein